MQRGRLAKAVLLAELARRKLDEFYDRVRTISEARLDKLVTWRPYLHTISWPEAISRLEERCGSVEGIEEECVQVQREVTRSIQSLTDKGAIPFASEHNADLALAATCYMVCRLTQPSVVVETGVAYGVTSAFILAALDSNGRGELHSIDLPPLARDADLFVGIHIPDTLKGRWHLCRADSRRILPRLMARLGCADLFVHDSLHTQRHKLFELRTVQAYIRRPGIVMADDVNENWAFLW